MVQMNMAGMDPDRMWEMLETRGAMNDLEKFKTFASTLMFFDPRTKNMEMSIGLRNIFPFLEQTTARGIGAALSRGLLGQNEGSAAGMVLENALGLGTAFVGNNPIGSAASIAIGYDPVSGAKLVDEKTPLAERLADYLKVAYQQVAPPLAPGLGPVPAGRIMDRIQTAAVAPLNPRTQRGYRAPKGFTSELIKGLLNVDVQGGPVKAADVALGVAGPRTERVVATDRDIIMSLSMHAQKELGQTGDDSQQFVESMANTLRRVYYKSIDEASTPAEKAAAEKEFAAMVTRHAELFGATVTAGGPTSSQVDRKRRELEMAGPLDSFARLPLDQQAAVLAEADRARVHDETLYACIKNVVTTKEGGITRESDPEAVLRAIEVLEDRAKKDGANHRLGDLAGWLKQNILPYATGRKMYTDQVTAVKDMARPLIEKQRAAIVDRVKG
jgi:hypothetical protein